MHQQLKRIMVNSGKLFCLLLFTVISNMAKAHNLDSLYTVLDMEIEKAKTYINAKEIRIRELENSLKRSRGNATRIEINLQLFDELTSFDDTKAKACLEEALKIAEKTGDNATIAQTCSFLAYQNSLSGYYPEALKWLNKVDELLIERKQLEYFYFAATHTYGEVAHYSNDRELRQKYFDLSEQYRIKFFNIADTTSSFYYQRQLIYLSNNGMLDEAEKLCRMWQKHITADSHDYAIMAYHLSECYRFRNDIDKRCYWLAVSAINDCRNAVMNQASLWMLAELVNKQGNLNRSREYVEYSWMCATKFGGHTRSWQVSPIINTINNDYRNLLSNNNHNLRILLIAVSILAVLFLLSLLFLYRRNKLLSTTRTELARTNTELADLNTKLHESNNKMGQINRQLHDSNLVKDEYIGKFLSLCSEYIDKIDAYRQKVNRRVKANQFKELLNMTNSEELCEKEAKELFANFDTVFLRIYPNFVEEFNALLLPEFYQQLGPNNELTTDMRMAALIRLGITDSSSIAEFLRLSPNTVYNYRARLKSRASGDRNKFEDRIKQIGL